MKEQLKDFWWDTDCHDLASPCHVPQSVQTTIGFCLYFETLGRNMLWNSLLYTVSMHHSGWFNKKNSQELGRQYFGGTGESGGKKKGGETRKQSRQH